jgi:glucose-1-phosphate thymidylyltransferase
MRGIILAGGSGQRLHPLTRVTNKHLLPVYDRPMIYYAIEQLASAGIERIMIVTGGNHAGEFLRLLGNGQEFGLKHLQYAYQDRPGGIAEALGLAEHFADGGQVLVMLGDNVIEGSVRRGANQFREQGRGAKGILKEVLDPRQYGVAELRDGRIVSIEEKPQKPKSAYAVTGIYFYDEEVFDVVRSLKPSGRGELEITDVNNWFVEQGTMEYDVVEGFWGDAGESIDAYYQVNDFVRAHGANRP